MRSEERGEEYRVESIERVKSEERRKEREVREEVRYN